MPQDDKNGYGRLNPFEAALLRAPPELGSKTCLLAKVSFNKIVLKENYTDSSVGVVVLDFFFAR